MTKEEFKRKQLFIDDNIIDELNKKFELEKIREVLSDIVNHESFAGAYDYYTRPFRHRMSLENISILREIDDLITCGKINDLKEAVENKIDNQKNE